MCILCTPRSIYRPSVGRHIDRYSADVSVDISADTRAMYRPRYVSRNVDRYVGRDIGRVSVDMSTEISAEYRSICRPTLDRYVNHWLSVEYRSTVGGISVDCRVLYYNQASNILDCSHSPIFPWDRRCRSLSSTGRHFGLSIRVKLEKRSRKTVCYSEQIMSADKNHSIFSLQMEGIVLIYHDYQLSNARPSLITSF